MLRRSALTVVLLLTVVSLSEGCRSARDEAGSSVIPPGHESEMAALFAGPPPSGAAAGYTLEDLGIAHDHVAVRFEGPEGPVELRLVPPGSSETPAGRTEFFDVILVGENTGESTGESTGGDANQDRREALAAWTTATVQARERVSPWVAASAAPSDSEGHDVREPSHRAIGDDGRLRAPTVETLYVHWVVPTLWALLALFGLWAMALRRHRAPHGDTVILLSVVGLALALRLWLPPFGPGDIKNTLLDAYYGWPDGTGFVDVGRYGRGVDGLLAWVFLIVPPDDRVVAGLNLLMSCLSVVALYALTRRLRFPRRVALVAALVLAVSPLSVRFGPTINRYVPLVFLALTGWSLLLAWFDERRAVDLIVSVLALSLASQCRPDALALPVVTLGLVVMKMIERENAPSPPPTGVATAPTGRGLWPLLLAGGAHALLLVPAAAPLIGRALAGGAEVAPYLDVGRPLFDPAHNPFFSTHYTPLLWPALAALGLLVGPRAAILWLALGALFLSALLCGAPSGTSQLLNARYHLPAIPLYAILIANGWEAVSRVARPLGRTPLYAGGVALIALAAAEPMPEVTRDTTMNAEYRFLEHALAEVPDDCDVVYYYPDHDHGLRPQHALSLSLGKRHRWTPVERWLRQNRGQRDTGRCAVFFRSSACAADGDRRTTDATRVCDRLEQRCLGDVLASEKVAAVPIREERYRGSRVRLSLCWLRHR